MLHVFIINPIAGKKDNSELLREYLKEKEDLNYLVFNSEEEGDEYNVAKRVLSLFEEETIRFYVCGGSGSFANTLSALSEDDFKRTEIAHYPVGLTNDYIRNFGDCDKFFLDIDGLIDGDVIKIDYGCIDDCSSELRTNKYVLAFATGYIERVNTTERKLSYFNFINPNCLYSISSFIHLFTCKRVNYKITIDDEDFSGPYIAVYVGNSVCTGGSYYPFRSAHAGDGYQEVLLLKACGIFDLIKYITWFKNGYIETKTDNNLIVKKAKRIYIERVDHKIMPLNIDGEYGCVDKIDAKICQNQLKYVVPRGFRLNACRDLIKTKE